MKWKLIHTMNLLSKCLAGGHIRNAIHMRVITLTFSLLSEYSHTVMTHTPGFRKMEAYIVNNIVLTKTLLSYTHELGAGQYN